jgi:hypothetical protein
MPFKKGHVKFGGRKPFTKNKITRDVIGLLNSLDCNPLEGMARIATDPKAPIALQARMYAELSQYVSPKLRSTEISGPGGGPIELDVNTDPDEQLERGIARINDRKRAERNLGQPDGSEKT